MTTIGYANGLCFCAGPWRNSIRVPPRVVERAHIPSLLCDTLEDQRPSWVRRMKDNARIYGKDMAR